MRIAREGWPFFWVAIALAMLLCVASVTLAWTGWPYLAIGAALSALFVLFFFRDPERTLPEDRALVLAPADGKVVEVTEVEEPLVMGGRCRRISIFLSIFDVHVQRAPVGGEVVHRSYRAGGYAVAWAPKASEENEQASVGILTDAGPVLVRQIAGLVARRIVTYPEEGDVLRPGERIGLIRFGSRVDLFLPLGWEVRTRPGERSVTGVTPMAVMPGTAPGGRSP